MYKHAANKGVHKSFLLCYVSTAVNRAATEIFLNLREMSKNSQNMPSQLHGVQGDVFKCHVLSDQQSKGQRDLVYYYIKQRKTGHIGEPCTKKYLALLHFEKIHRTSKIDRSIKSTNRPLMSPIGQINLTHISKQMILDLSLTQPLPF